MIKFFRALSFEEFKRFLLIFFVVQASLEATWNQAKHQGFWATWAQLVDLTDPRGEINAYKVRSRNFFGFKFILKNNNSNLLLTLAIF